MSSLLLENGVYCSKDTTESERKFFHKFRGKLNMFSCGVVGYDTISINNKKFHIEWNRTNFFNQKGYAATVLNQKSELVDLQNNTCNSLEDLKSLIKNELINILNEEKKENE